jgi:branched-chain amino acid transport system substrate-binding protein
MERIAKVGMMVMLLLVTVLFGAGEGIAAEPIKVGLVGIMTGPNALNGEYCAEGAKVAVAEINKAGGIKPAGEASGRQIEFIIEDDGGNPQVGINAINKLIHQHKVFAFLGPDYSSVTFPSMFVAQQAGIPQLT